jgi:hypothetical protein
MSNDKEFKKYDTQSSTQYFNVRLAKDAQVKEFSDNKLVSLTFVDSSRVEADEELWVEANPNKGSQALCSYLLKGDVLSFRSGKLTMRRYGDDKEKIAFNLRNAEPVIPIDLLITVKERGFTPGSDTFFGGEEVVAKPVKGKPGRPKGSGKVVATTKPAKKTIPIEIDLDDDEAEDE